MEHKLTRCAYVVRPKSFRPYHFIRRRKLINWCFYLVHCIYFSNQLPFADKHFFQRTGRAMKTSRKKVRDKMETQFLTVSQSVCTFKMFAGVSPVKKAIVWWSQIVTMRWIPPLFETTAVDFLQGSSTRVHRSVVLKEPMRLASCLANFAKDLSN